MKVRVPVLEECCECCDACQGVGRMVSWQDVVVSMHTWARWQLLGKIPRGLRMPDGAGVWENDGPSDFLLARSKYGDKGLASEGDAAADQRGARK